MTKFVATCITLHMSGIHHNGIIAHMVGDLELKGPHGWLQEKWHRSSGADLLWHAESVTLGLITVQ